MTAASGRPLPARLALVKPASDLLPACFGHYGEDGRPCSVCPNADDCARVTVRTLRVRAERTRFVALVVLLVALVSFLVSLA